MLLGGIITELLSWRWVLLINPPIGDRARRWSPTRVVAERRAHRDATLRPRRRADADDRPDGPRLRRRRSGPEGLEHVRRARPDHPRHRAARRVRPDRDALRIRPLIPFKELTKPLRAANNIVLLFSAALFPMWFVSSLYLQQVLGLSPLHTGLIFLPMTLAIMLVASRAGKLVEPLRRAPGARRRPGR